MRCVGRRDSLSCVSESLAHGWSRASADDAVEMSMTAAGVGMTSTVVHTKESR